MAIEGCASANAPPSGRSPLTPAQARALASIVAAVPPLLRQSYGEALLAVVLFGFVARGTPHPHSDSDWLVVVRQRGCEEARRALAPELAAAAGLLSEPQFHLRSAAEAEQGGPLFLDLCHEGRILHDLEGWAARFLMGRRMASGRWWRPGRPCGSRSGSSLGLEGSMTVAMVGCPARLVGTGSGRHGRSLALPPQPWSSRDMTVLA
jgi:hypothetical protein